MAQQCRPHYGLAQFRDNIIVASAVPATHSAMCDVCGILTDTWSLCVLCPCMKKRDDLCTHLCMTQDLQAPRICLHMSNGRGSCVVHPSTFTAQWTLKLGPPLQSAWAVHEATLANLYTGVLVNCLPFISSWGGLLMSCVAWVTMGLICGHSVLVTLRAAHWALTYVVARTHYAVGPSRQCIAFLMPHLPAPTRIFDRPMAPALCLLGRLTLCVVSCRS